MHADEIAVWNRTAMQRDGPLPREGDVALSALLGIHGLVMNGGVFHAVEVVKADGLRAACSGFRYFGFEEVAALLEAASNEAWTEESETRFDTGYWGMVDDAAIGRRFHEHFASNRERYAP